MLVVILIGFILVSLGSLIAIMRMDVDINLSDFIIYLYYNSWTATIQPVLLMMEAEYEIGPTLFGKSYFDLMISVIPTFIYLFFDQQKPITIDNPAAWFFVQGMGGMHAVGVAWRNFGLFGVFLQCTLVVSLLSRLERVLIAKKSFWTQFFYLVVASQLMHTIWYSLINIINGLVLFFLIYFVFNIEYIPKFIAGKKVNK
jgi:hypothetical protein